MRLVMTLLGHRWHLWRLPEHDPTDQREMPRRSYCGRDLPLGLPSRAGLDTDKDVCRRCHAGLRREMDRDWWRVYRVVRARERELAG